MRQISTLLCCLSHDAKDMLHSTNLTEEDQKDYSKVVRKFNSHFKALTHLIFKSSYVIIKQQLNILYCTVWFHGIC